MSAHWYWDWDWNGSGSGIKDLSRSRAGKKKTDSDDRPDGHSAKPRHKAGDQAPFPFPSVKPCQKVQVYFGTTEMDDGTDDPPHYPSGKNGWQHFSQQEQYEDGIGHFTAVGGVGLPPTTLGVLALSSSGGQLAPSTTYFYCVTATYATNKVDTLKFVDLGGSGSPPTFVLTVEGVSTTPISYTSNPSDLVSHINTALDAAFGPSAIVAGPPSGSPLSLSNIILTFADPGALGAVQATAQAGNTSYTINGSATTSTCPVLMPGVGESVVSNEVSQPTAASAGSQITIGWTAPSGANLFGARPTGYKVYRGTAMGQELYLDQAPAGAVSYQDSTVTTDPSGLPPNPILWFWAKCEQSSDCCKRCDYYRTMSRLPNQRPVGPGFHMEWVYVDDFKCRCVPNPPP